MISYRVVPDGEWYVVLREEGAAARVLARYLDELEAQEVCRACERATAAPAG
jgi:hypothetical protein